MKLSIAIAFIVFAVYIQHTEAFVPKECNVIIDECKKWGNQVKDWLIERCCTKCGLPIPFKAAKKYIDEATHELSSSIIPYVKGKIPKLPKDITPKWICEVAKSVEEAFNHHEDLCKFDQNNPQHKKEIEKCKSIAMQKAMPKAMGMLPMAGECKKGVGIPTHIMHDIPVGKANSPPLNILKLMDAKCSALCNDLKKGGKK